MHDNKVDQLQTFMWSGGATVQFEQGLTATDFYKKKLGLVAEAITKADRWSSKNADRLVTRFAHIQRHLDSMVQRLLHTKDGAWLQGQQTHCDNQNDILKKWVVLCRIHAGLT